MLDGLFQFDSCLVSLTSSPAFVLEQIIITRFGISDQFSYQIQEFILKNDTPENGTSV